MKKFFILLIIQLFICNSVFATTWIQVDDYNFIDIDSIATYTDDYGNVQFNKKICWMKCLNTNGLYKEIEKVLNKKIDYSINLRIFDYSLKKTAIKSSTSYDEEGTPVFAHSYKDYELMWDNITPDSRGEAWAYLIKHKKILKNMLKQQNLQKKEM